MKLQLIYNQLVKVIELKDGVLSKLFLEGGQTDLAREVKVKIGCLHESCGQSQDERIREFLTEVKKSTCRERPNPAAQPSQPEQKSESFLT